MAPNSDPPAPQRAACACGLAYRSVSIAGRGMERRAGFVDRCDHITQIKALRPSWADAPSVTAEVRERACQICFVCPAVAWPRAVPPGWTRLNRNGMISKRGTPRRSRGRNACTAISRPRLWFLSATVPAQHPDSLRVGCWDCRALHSGVVPGSQERSPREEN